MQITLEHIEVAKVAETTREIAPLGALFSSIALGGISIVVEETSVVGIGMLGPLNSAIQKVFCAQMGEIGGVTGREIHSLNHFVINALGVVLPMFRGGSNFTAVSSRESDSLGVNGLAFSVTKSGEVGICI